MAALPAYSVGGSLHIVINNHIGFTTLPAEGRSSELCTDVATAAGVPVIHANADDAEAVVRALREAFAWREEWGRDVVVNVIGYRCSFGALDVWACPVTYRSTFVNVSARMLPLRPGCQ
jgi:2-oxoglutarate dehydrogenase complex dehydrogenase (E1) component-like enzyme